MFRISAFGAINFMSFQEVVVVPEGKCYVVQAENRDDSGQRSNGGGKTSLLEIIPVTLTGSSITGRNVKDCVNWKSQDKCFITFVELENELHNMSVRIERTVYSNTKSAELVILVNGEVPKTIPTKAGVENGVDIKAGNEYILKEILDITKEDLFNYFIIARGQYQPFLQANVDRKTEVISRFNNTAIIEQIIEELGTSRKTKTSESQALERKISEAEGYITALTESVSEEAEHRFEHEKQSKLERQEQRREEVEQKIVQLSTEIGGVKTKIDELSVTKPDIDEETLTKYDIAINDLKTKIRDLGVKRTQLQRQSGAIETYLAGQIQCPKCSHWFNPKPTEGKAPTKVDLNHVKFDISKTEEDEVKLKEEMANIEDLTKTEREKSDQLRQINNQIMMLERQIKMLDQQSDRLRQELYNIDFDINQIAAETFADGVTDVLEKIDAKEAELKAMRKKHEKLIREIDQVSAWEDRFGEFKFHLANKPLEQIVALINEYLILNESDLNISIQGFRKLKNGELRPDLNPIIYRNWTNPQNYAQFSEGEKCRLNISVDLTFQQLINSASKYGGLDFYCNDELMNAMDSLGISNAAEAFNRLGKTIFLVSHSGSDMVYENTIKIVKENGESKVLAS